MTIFRYLTRQLLTVWLAVSGILLVILLSSRFIDYLGQAAAGDMKISYLFFIILYRIPSFLDIIFPLAFFLSILLVYGRLYAENEMVVLESSGLTPYRLLKYTAGTGCIVMIATALLSLWLTPAGMKKTEQLLSVQDSLTALDMIQSGKFDKEGNYTYFVERVADNKRHMKNVFLVQFNKADNKDKMTVFSAKGGRVEVKHNLRYMVLEDGYRYDMTPGHLGGRVTQYKKYGTFVKNNPIEPVTAEETLPTTTLLSKYTPRAEAEWQWRISLILMVPIAMFLALPLSRVRPRQGRYFKLLPSLLIYLIYLSLLMSMQGSLKHSHAAVYPGLYGVNLIFALLGAVLFYWKPLKRLIIKGRRL